MRFTLSDKRKEIGHVEVDDYARELEIDYIYVEPDFRRKGFGSVLLNTAIAYADLRRKDLTLIVGGAGGMNNSALTEWYARHGFVKENVGMRRKFKEKENTNDGFDKSLSGEAFRHG